MTKSWLIEFNKKRTFLKSSKNNLISVDKYMWAVSNLNYKKEFQIKKIHSKSFKEREKHF